MAFGHRAPKYRPQRDRLPAPCPLASPNRGRAAAPFLWIKTARGNVEVWALGEDRFRITAPGHD
jgi:hypothetical protein